LAHIIQDKNLKLIAIAGTHGKTTTTGMLVWAMNQLGIPTSYSIGTTLSWGPSGKFDPASEYFVYECDEFDRNFLHFEPHLSIITALDYDHPDTYPTREDYCQAFVDFLGKSENSLLWSKDLRYLMQPDIPATYQAYDELMNLSHIKLAGDHTRHNAFLVEQAAKIISENQSGVVEAINSFPGTNRRFEKLGPNLYSDYGHHPVEIAASLQMAREISDNAVLVYQPHQNVRQHEIRQLYTNEVFKGAQEIYWLPTYLSREAPELEILTPAELTSELNATKLHQADLNDNLWDEIQRHIDAGHLVLCMGAGSIDGWVRQQLVSN
jgi:UDP-N-acetylmuramate--alanine ligase